jgi:hypothetical protein
VVKQFFSGNIMMCQQKTKEDARMNSFMKGMTTGVLLSSAAVATVATMMPKNKKSTKTDEY